MILHKSLQPKLNTISIQFSACPATGVSHAGGIAPTVRLIAFPMVQSAAAPVALMNMKTGIGLEITGLGSALRWMGKPSEGLDLGSGNEYQKPLNRQADMRTAPNLTTPTPASEYLNDDSPKLNDLIEKLFKTRNKVPCSGKVASLRQRRTCMTEGCQP